jgi:hypothetical protein
MDCDHALAYSIVQLLPHAERSLPWFSHFTPCASAYRVAVKEFLEVVAFNKQFFWAGRHRLDQYSCQTCWQNKYQRTSSDMPWLMLRQVDKNKMQHQSKMYNNSLTTSEIR